MTEQEIEALRPAIEKAARAMIASCPGRFGDYAGWADDAYHYLEDLLEAADLQDHRTEVREDENGYAAGFEIVAPDGWRSDFVEPFDTGEEDVAGNYGVSDETICICVDALIDLRKRAEPGRQLAPADTLVLTVDIRGLTRFQIARLLVDISQEAGISASLDLEHEFDATTMGTRENREPRTGCWKFQ